MLLDRASVNGLRPIVKTVETDSPRLLMRRDGTYVAPIRHAGCLKRYNDLFWCASHDTG
jgi:hypothetical protein